MPFQNKLKTGSRQIPPWDEHSYDEEAFRTIAIVVAGVLIAFAVIYLTVKGGY